MEIRNEQKCEKKLALQRFYEYCIDHAYSDEPITDFQDEFNRSSQVAFFNTIKVLMWTCDARSGLGVDKYVKEMLEFLASSQQIKTGFRIKVVDSLIHLGKWDLCAGMIQYPIPAKVRTIIYQKIGRALEGGNTNCARAMPRRGSTANRIRGFMKLSPKQWREKLVPLCADQVCALMSANRWEEIDYTHLPVYLLVAYYNAFKKHDKSRFVAYLRDNPGRSITISRILKKKLIRKPPMNLTAVLALQYMPDTKTTDGKGGEHHVRPVRK